MCPSLTYFTEQKILQVHARGCKWQDFLLFMAEYYSTVYAHHIFFIHSLTDGHLRCFQVLAVVNTAIHMRDL